MTRHYKVRRCPDCGKRQRTVVCVRADCLVGKAELTEAEFLACMDALGPWRTELDNVVDTGYCVVPKGARNAPANP